MTNFPEVISLNVGGRHFDTTLTTLLRYEDSMLAAMFSGRHRVVTDKDGRYFIDRDGSHFSHILEFLRQDKLPPSEVTREVLADAEFYGLQQLSEKIKNTSVPLFLEAVLRKRRAAFLEAHPKLASLTLDVIGLARKKFQENPNTTSTVAIWIPDQTFPIEVIRGSTHDCSVGCLIAGYISDDTITKYMRYSGNYFQECGYKVDIKRDQPCRMSLYGCEDCVLIFKESTQTCSNCRVYNYGNRRSCRRQKLCFSFSWSVVDINPPLKHLFCL